MEKKEEDITPCKFGIPSFPYERGWLSITGKGRHITTHQVQDPVKKMEEALVQATNECTDDAISETDYIGIIVDETVNVTIDKKLIICQFEN